MAIYSQVEHALVSLGYPIDFDSRYPVKLIGYILVEGYTNEVILEFREAINSELGNCEELLQVEWLMDDGESYLFLDRSTLDERDESPDVFEKEKIILRDIFDRISKEIGLR
jgi:hypothetical protein